MSNRFTVRGLSSLLDMNSVLPDAFFTRDTRQELEEAQRAYDAWFDRTLGALPLSEQYTAEEAVNEYNAAILRILPQGPRK